MNLKLLFNLFISFIHFVLAYGLLMTAILSNNIKILISVLIIMSMIKFAFYFFGRCILTLYEYNPYFAPVSKLLSYTLTNNITDKKGEEILINAGILIVLNKIFALTIYNYYKNI
jgi:hypothetical protein